MRRWLALGLGSIALALLAHAIHPAVSAARTGTPFAAPAPGQAPAAGPPAGGAPQVTGSAATAAPAPDYLAQARAGYTPQNRAYNRTRVMLRLLSPLYSILVLLVLLGSGLSARFRDIAEGLGRRLYVRVLVYFALYATAVFVLELPRQWFSGFALEHQYGLSTQGFSAWLGDSFKGLVFDIVSLGVLPLLAFAWAAIERWPHGWWWRIAAATLPVAMVATLLQPIVFEPLFNKFTPLHDTVLRERILALGQRAGIPARKVLEVDMSRRTRRVNAYVSGYGASQRIVLWDTTLQALQSDEILSVMGHEMGHYVLGHIWRFLVVLAFGAFVALRLAAWLAEALVAAFSRAWGLRGLTDLATLPVYAFALGAVLAVAEPGVNALTRDTEHEADVFALEITHDNDAAARAFLKVARDNRSDPEPAAWVRLLFYDHPPLGERIQFALAYRPWEQGRPNRFFHPR